MRWEALMEKLSYVHGTSDIPLMGQTIGAFFDDIAARFQNRDALIVPGQGVHWTYGELQRHVNFLASSLLRLGLEPGDRIGIWSPNNFEWVLTQFATAKAGLVLVNINPAYRRAELEYALNKVGCKALILSPRFKTSDYLSIVLDLAPEITSCAAGQTKAAKLPELRTLIRLGEEETAGMLNFGRLLSEPSEEDRSRLSSIGRDLQFDDPINIQFTSGTTGSPKGATLTHHNILNNGFFVGEAMRLTEHDRVCIPVPFYHCFGMVLGNLACVTHGACMVIPSGSFDP